MKADILDIMRRASRWQHPENRAPVVVHLFPTTSVDELQIAVSSDAIILTEAHILSMDCLGVDEVVNNPHRYATSRVEGGESQSARTVIPACRQS